MGSKLLKYSSWTNPGIYPTVLWTWNIVSTFKVFLRRHFSDVVGKAQRCSDDDFCGWTKRNKNISRENLEISIISDRAQKPNGDRLCDQRKEIGTNLVRMYIYEGFTKISLYAYMHGTSICCCWYSYQALRKPWGLHSCCGDVKTLGKVGTFRFLHMQCSTRRHNMYLIPGITWFVVPADPGAGRRVPADGTAPEGQGRGGRAEGGEGGGGHGECSEAPASGQDRCGGWSAATGQAREKWFLFLLYTCRCFCCQGVGTRFLFSYYGYFRDRYLYRSLICAHSCYR